MSIAPRTASYDRLIRKFDNLYELRDLVENMQWRKSSQRIYYKNIIIGKHGDDVITFGSANACYFISDLLERLEYWTNEI